METHRQENRAYQDAMLQSHSIVQRTEEMCHVRQEMISSQGVTLENLELGKDRILTKSDEQLSVAQDTQALIRALQK